MSTEHDEARAYLDQIANVDLDSVPRVVVLRIARELRRLLALVLS